MALECVMNFGNHLEIPMKRDEKVSSDELVLIESNRNTEKPYCIWPLK